MQGKPSRPENTWRIRASTTKNTHANGQLHGAFGSHGQYPTAPDEGNGYEILLVEVQRCTGTIQVLLDAWHPKFGRLFYKTFSGRAPQSNATPIPYAQKAPRKLEATKIGGKATRGISAGPHRISIKNPIFMTREGVLEFWVRLGTPNIGTVS